MLRADGLRRSRREKKEAGARRSETVSKDVGCTVYDINCLVTVDSACCPQKKYAN
jgi:hypothetical protein